MKALSIHPVYAALILYGEKTIECRTWKTDYRGDILICSTAHKLKDTIPSHALCVVELTDITPFSRDDLEAACMQPNEFNSDCYAWHFDHLRLIKPFAVKGKLSLWNCNEKVKVYPEYWETIEECEKVLTTYYDPLFV